MKDRAKLLRMTTLATALYLPACCIPGNGPQGNWDAADKEIQCSCQSCHEKKLGQITATFTHVLYNCLMAKPVASYPAANLALGIMAEG